MNSTQRIEIISAYMRTFENLQCTVGRELDLPFPKELIRQALSEELINPTATYLEKLDILEWGFLELESFLPDEEFEIVKRVEQAIIKSKQIKDKRRDQNSMNEAIDLLKDMQDTVEKHVEVLNKIEHQKKQRLAQLQKIIGCKQKK